MYFECFLVGNTFTASNFLLCSSPYRCLPKGRIWSLSYIRKPNKEHTVIVIIASISLITNYSGIEHPFLSNVPGCFIISMITEFGNSRTRENSFSMTPYRILFHNNLMTSRFFACSPFTPDSIKNHQYVNEFLYFSTMAD